MDYVDAKIYLALYQSHNISTVAQSVGMTQSAISQRLQKLEREFGTPLLLRGRGQKNVEPTKQGERLLPIAQQWVDLYESVKLVDQEAERSALKISCTNSIGAYLLPSFFYGYAQEHSNLLLDIHTNHSWEILELLETGAIDIGLTNRDDAHYHDGILLEKVHQERFVLLTGQQAGERYGKEPVHPKDLDPGRELYFDITPSFAQWRQEWWSNKKPFLQSSFAQVFPTILTGGPYWSILPLSIARSFAKLYDLKISELAQRPDDRVSSVALHHKFSAHKAQEKEELIRALRRFFQALSESEG